MYSPTILLAISPFDEPPTPSQTINILLAGLTVQGAGQIKSSWFFLLPGSFKK
jgi:hypothetical protein